MSLSVVEIIRPKRMYRDNFAACEKEFTQYKRGFFYSEASGRYYGINYAILNYMDIGRQII